MPTPEHATSLIARQADLDAACAFIGHPEELPVDTEFARTDTYRPKLCLIQASARSRAFCVDMLAGLDAGALWDTMVSIGTLKLLHAAKQDLEVLLLTFGALPGPIFDTQIAAALLGYPPQVGYAALVEAELGVRLDKTQTRTDWSRRPLTPAQIEYAANDVAHLAELAGGLRTRLAQQGRADWALEDSAALLDPSLYGLRPEDAWQRLSGVDYQPIEVQARARRLAAWRELTADRANRPRQWILTDQALTTLAARNPADIAGIEALAVLTPGALRNSGKALLAELRQADADLAAGEPAFAQRSRPAPLDNGDLKRLGAIVQQAAAGLGIAPEILATRADLAALLRGARELRPLRGWRREIVGEALLAAISGPAPS